jgi:lycopene cyclase domain-containing protein
MAMAIEYLLFNLIVIIGPILRSFEPRLHFFRLWPQALLSAAIVGLPFLVWDSLVSGRHWWFNSEYTLPLRIAGLPPGEILFFFTVPFAIIFTHEVIRLFVAERNFRLPAFFIYTLAAILLSGSVAAFYHGLEYTGLAQSALLLALLLDHFSGQRIIGSGWRFLLFVAIVLLSTLIFNYYLTARPLVLYDPAFQLDFRIITIPIEDFIYGLALLWLNVRVYEWLKERHG